MFAVRGRGLNTQLPAQQPLKHPTSPNPTPPPPSAKPNQAPRFFGSDRNRNQPAVAERPKQACERLESIHHGERQVVAVIPGIVFIRNATEEEGRRFRQLLFSVKHARPPEIWRSKVSQRCLFLFRPFSLQTLSQLLQAQIMCDDVLKAPVSSDITLCFSEFAAK